MNQYQHTAPISYTDAVHKLYQLAQQHHTTRSSTTRSLPLTDSIGYVSSQSINWSLNIPSYNTAAMDGYLISAHHTTKTTADQPVRFEIVDCIAAGANHTVVDTNTNKLYAVEIMTGGAIPDEWCNQHMNGCVIRIEDTKLITMGNVRYIDVPILCKPYQHVKRIGEDYQLDTCIIHSNQLITPQHIMLLAMNGNHTVQVHHKLSIGIINTGNEVINQYNQSDTIQLEYGELYNSNVPYIIATLERYYNCTAHHIASIDDNLHDTIQCINDSINSMKYDILITTGAVSAGKFDYIPNAINSIESCHKLFHQVSIRPGRPILVSHSHHNIPIFSFPGTPIAVMIGLRFFVAPYIAMLLYNINVDILLQSSLILPVAHNVTSSDRFSQFIPCIIQSINHSSPTQIHILSDKNQNKPRCSSISNIQDATHWLYLPCSTTPHINANANCTVHTMQPEYLYVTSHESNHRYTNNHIHTNGSSQPNGSTNGTIHKPIANGEEMLCHGLVVCGGYSSRMGTDKALLQHYTTKQPMLQYMVQQLQSVNCHNISVSCRQQQIDSFSEVLHNHVDTQSIEMISDTYTDFGPAGGILSVYTHHSKQSIYNTYLIIAIDFPYATVDSIQYLLHQHMNSPHSLITCYQHTDGMPEPLFAVWSSVALSCLQNNVVSNKRTGPCYTIKQLIKQNNQLVNLVKPIDHKCLINTNTMEQYNAVKT